MKIKFLKFMLCACVVSATALGQAPDDYINIVRQIPIPSAPGSAWDVPVAREGEELSPLKIGDGGARFELWTVQSDPFVAYLLDSTYVGAYIPVATVVITTEDPDTYNAIPRTRADRPFRVEVVTDGLLNGEKDPEASKKVNLLRHVQSYGEGGVGENLDRKQATQQSSAYLNSNKTFVLDYGLSEVPGADRSKIRGEERFSVYTLEDARKDYVVPPSQLASQTVQIWPVADGTITGIASGDVVRFQVPQLTFTLKDLYPKSTTYAQVYKGVAALGTVGTVLPGSALVINDAVPQDRVLVIQDYADTLTDSGDWTIELLTETPFGIDRLAHVTFTLDRTLKVRGSMNTYE